MVGAGINGVTAAIELKKRGHKVVLVDPGPLPHPLAASTDISKAVRTAYGADEYYTALAERAIPLWRKWNEEFGFELYHETGVLFVRRELMQPGDFEYESCKIFEKRGHKFERLNSAKLRKRFPAFNAERFHDGFFDPEAGYVESGRVVVTLVEQARLLGVELVEGIKFIALDENDNSVNGIVLQDRKRIGGDAVVVAVGAWTPYVLPFTRKFFRATGHPVFHLNREGVVKIANHGPGREMSPELPERTVTPEEEKKLREFLTTAIPALTEAPIVYTRICLYCDTHDGDFWIASDPERRGLVIATGDSGHGFKFAPLLGEIAADAVEGKSNPLLEKFRWRPEVRSGLAKEAARFQP